MVDRIVSPRLKGKNDPTFLLLLMIFFFSGTMYLTDNLICFHSRLSQQFAIPFRDIAGLSTYSSLGIVDAIKIETRSGQIYHFANFSEREQTYLALEELWDLSMCKILKVKKTEGENRFGANKKKKKKVCSSSDY